MSANLVSGAAAAAFGKDGKVPAAILSSGRSDAVDKTSNKYLLVYIFSVHAS